MSKEENIKNLTRLIDEVMNGKNYDVINELVSPDYALHDSTRDVFHGAAGFRQFADRMHTVFPDMHATVEDTVADGDKASFRIMFSGTHKGTLMGIPATNKYISYPIQLFSYFKDGKVTETWRSYDMLSIFQQLGVAPRLEQAVR